MVVMASIADAALTRDGAADAVVFWIGLNKAALVVVDVFAIALLPWCF